MKTYIGTKTLRAKPMTRADYNELRGWELPADENPDDEGYLVEYLDGGKSNHVGFTGYISWSPKAQFEAAYMDIGDVSGMPDYMQRVLGEAKQLDEKREKLHAFINGNTFSVFCNDAEQARLIGQYQAMSNYSEYLWLRIESARDSK